MDNSITWPEVAYFSTSSPGNNFDRHKGCWVKCHFSRPHPILSDCQIGKQL
ncbi:hypothetical protein FC85_GL001903 [Lentilactobacillus diolivorans DSM 14421]|uniref:Uncharacterized protein n=1 Tax=Lentilactobacillus diolivorans DSM 14421 TaxID=1423739 RepID=A0A0R1S1F2_9LACO|nr:hypothetical protein FC85_GL001903 [Lentilactobacillus diolivorans DSM 14421]